MSGEPEAEEELPSDQEKLPTAAEAADWITQTRPAAVLALLKQPEYRAAVTPVFAGFRPDPKSLALPLVRSRLSEAASKDKKLAEKLRSLFETDPKAEPTPPKKAAETVLISPAPSPPVQPDPVPAFRAERDARRRERDAARADLTVAQASLETAEKARVQAEAERDDARLNAKKQADRIARLERQVLQAKQTEARLVKALNKDKVSPPPTPRPRGSVQTPTETASISAAWPVAVRHLLDKAKFETVLALTLDVLKTDAEDLDALQLAASAWEGLKEPRQTISLVRRLLELHQRRSDWPAASDALLSLFKLMPTPELAEPDVRTYLAALPTMDPGAVSAARLMLGRLRSLSPAAQNWLAAYVRDRTTLGPVLMPPPEALGPDDPLPFSLPLGRSVTARHLTEAIDRMQEILVGPARDTLRTLEASDPETAARVWAALEQAATDDPARLLALRREPRGAAVVDGSNVAWFDQESLVHGMPRLRPLLAMRRALWARGFFPVLLYTDANLRYFIDDKLTLMRMRDRQELTFVDAGTAADEVLLRVAKQRSAPLITNDRMEDWDPEGTVKKVRYAISMSGEATLLSEI